MFSSVLVLVLWSHKNACTGIWAKLFIYIGRLFTLIHRYCPSLALLHILHIVPILCLPHPLCAVPEPRSHPLLLTPTIPPLHTPFLGIFPEPSQGTLTQSPQSLLHFPCTHCHPAATTFLGLATSCWFTHLSVRWKPARSCIA